MEEGLSSILSVPDVQSASFSSRCLLNPSRQSQHALQIETVKKKLFEGEEENGGRDSQWNDGQTHDGSQVSDKYRQHMNTHVHVIN